jgi:UDP-glucose:(heptosyl)LPS alpha-1,3-glucosyltransferase
MKLAFCLFKYFPYGGLQRDFLRIALACVKRGHDVHVYTMDWQGEIPEGLQVTIIPAQGIWNHKRCLAFAKQANECFTSKNYDAVIGFNKIPGLDIYFAADPCYAAKAHAERSKLYRLTERYRTYAKLEQAVFTSEAKTAIWLISEREQAQFEKFHQTPNSRFHLLAPSIDRNHIQQEQPASARLLVRNELKIPLDDYCVLMVGSSFKTKGVDRALLALAALPDVVRNKTHLVIIGQGNSKPFLQLAKKLQVNDHVHFLGGRDDVPRFLYAADLLLHPAYTENTGTVLVEALVAGLPVLTTEVCGYAKHILFARAGMVLPLPFTQSALNQELASMLASKQHDYWRRNALNYTAKTDLYSMVEQAVDFIENNFQAKSNHPHPNPPPCRGRGQASKTSCRERGQESEAPEKEKEQESTDSNVGWTKERSDVSTISDSNNTRRFVHPTVYLNPELQTHFQNKDVFTEVFKLDGEFFRQQKNRETLRVNIDNKNYFLKRHGGIGWREIIKNLFQLRVPVLSAQPEWVAIKKLDALAIPTTPLAGYGKQGHNPAHLSSFLLTEEITNPISLEDFCRHWPAQPPALNLRRALVKQLAHIARTLHDNGMNHRDFYLCHFLLDASQPLTTINIKLSLIDLHRAQHHHKTPQRAIIKDLAALYFSALDIGLTTRDIARFIKFYSGQPLKKNQKLWNKISERALKLYAKIQLKNLNALAPTQTFKPFWLTYENPKNIFLCNQLIRTVPDKRWVFFAQWQQQSVVIKLFKHVRHAEKELQGNQLLHNMHIATPTVLFHGWLQGIGLYAIVYERITNAQNLSAAWEQANLKQKTGLLNSLLSTIAKLHQAGIKHTDPHFKNFLVTINQEIVVLDPAAIIQNQQPANEHVNGKNLALLLAQLSPNYHYNLENCYRFYLQTLGTAFTTAGLQDLEKYIAYWHKHRLQAFSRKVSRSSTAFICRHSWRQFSVCDRTYDANAMRLFLADPEAALQNHSTKILKSGNTCTVMLIEISGHKLVVKRYNMKSFWHQLKRALQPTRAMISWRNAQRLMLLDFPTAKPVAILEQRLGPLRSTSYFISEYVSGTLLQDYLINTHLREERLLIVEKITTALNQLAKVHISHGDLKASNILIAGSQPIFLDLDAMRLHNFSWAWHKAQHKDWQRLLKNWQHQPEIKEIFEKTN